MWHVVWWSVQSCGTTLEVREPLSVPDHTDLPHVVTSLGPCLFIWEMKSAGWPLLVDSLGWPGLDSGHMTAASEPPNLRLEGLLSKAHLWAGPPPI